MACRPGAGRCFGRAPRCGSQPALLRSSLPGPSRAPGGLSRDQARHRLRRAAHSVSWIRSPGAMPSSAASCRSTSLFARTTSPTVPSRPPRRTVLGQPVVTAWSPNGVQTMSAPAVTSTPPQYARSSSRHADASRSSRERRESSKESEDTPHLSRRTGGVRKQCMSGQRGRCYRWPTAFATGGWTKLKAECFRARVARSGRAADRNRHVKIRATTGVTPTVVGVRTSCGPASTACAAGARRRQASPG